MKMSALRVAAVLAVGSTGAAMAADLPMRTAPAAPYYAAPLFTWTGFYVGANAGAAFGGDGGLATPNGFTTANGFPNAAAPGAGFGPFRGRGAGTGFVGGGQIGYNLQSGMFVYGVEADIDYLGQGGGGSRTFADTNVFPTAGSTFTLTRRSGDGYLGTVRGRLGVAAFDRTLLYVTGGLAYGDYGSSYRGQFSNGAGLVSNYAGSGGDSTRVGYALGAGAEYAFTPNISGKVEYLYADIGDRSTRLTNPATASSFTVKTDGSTQLARVGVNYKF